MAALSELRQVAQYLRNAAPEQFDEFRAAFASYENEFLTALIEASVDIQRVQGQVQVCRALSRMLREIK